jgi:hypothetical protein
MALKPLKPHQSALVAAGILAVVIWAIPIAQQLMLPLMYLNTHLHELFHALTAEGTGGHAKEIVVFANGSGVTPVLTAGPMGMLMTASAGYVGAAIAGGLMIYFGRTPKGARNVLLTTAIVLALSMLLWVRGDTIGVFSGIFWTGALFAASRFLKDNWLVFTAQFVGLQQGLNAFQSLYTLLQLSAFTNSHSDAMIMQQASGIPAILWALAWCAFSLFVVGLTLRAAWRQPIQRAE